MKTERKIAKRKIKRKKLGKGGDYKPSKVTFRHHKGINGTEEIESAHFTFINAGIEMQNFAAIINNGNGLNMMIPKTELIEPGKYFYKKPTKEDFIREINTTDGKMRLYSVDIIEEYP